MPGVKLTKFSWLSASPDSPSRPGRAERITLYRSGQLRLGAGAGAGRVIEHEVGFPEVAEGLGVRSV